MFNISVRKQGGLYFWRVGRISGSVNIQSPAAYRTMVQKKIDAVALAALVSALK